MILDTIRNRITNAGLFAIAVVSGTVAALLVLYQYDYRPLWLEQVNARWVLPSDRLAERGYALMSSGQTERAVETFRLAVVLDASSPYRWCDYGEALLAAGDRTGARKSIAQGLVLGPHIGPILMRGVNFGYSVSDSGAALRSGRDLIGQTNAYDGAVFSTWGRMEIPVSEILKNGLPDERSGQVFLEFTIAQKSLDDANRAWDWLQAHGWTSNRIAGIY